MGFVKQVTTYLQQVLPGWQHALPALQQLSVLLVVLAYTTVPATNKIAAILKISFFMTLYFNCFYLINFFNVSTNDTHIKQFQEDENSRTERMKQNCYPLPA